MGGLADEVEERYDYALTLPLDIEITQGPNWMEQVELDID
jgi:hypothetical protein